jgi:hypothetical protein
MLWIAQAETQSLRRTRDLLLPRLLLGQVRLGNELSDEEIH